MRYITAQKRVSGLGSAHSGTGHFISQRVSAVALLLLIPLFLIFVAPHFFEDPSAVKSAFAGSLWTGVIAAATAITVAMHLVQGLQVVIEDYTKGAMRIGLMLAMKIGVLVLTLSALWAIIMLSLAS